MRNFLNREKAELSSKEVTVLEPIEAPGPYRFQIADIRMSDSRHNLDGSEKEHLPEYSDETRELFMVLKDVVSGKAHMTRMTCDAFVKFKSLTEAERKSLVKYKLKEDNRDGYALLWNAETKSYERIPSQEGEEEFEGLRNIFSRFVSALGLPEGTTHEEFELFKGRYFKGKLVLKDYTSNLGEDKQKLKLSTTYYAIPDEEIEAIKEFGNSAEAFR
jgi:hypothetical protein